MQNIEQLKAEITEIEQCLKLAPKEFKQTSFEKRINNYLQKKLEEKKLELTNIQAVV